MLQSGYWWRRRFAHSILICAWHDIISAGIALQDELQKFANKCSLEAQAAFVEELKRAWDIGLFLFSDFWFDVIMHPARLFVSWDRFQIG